MQPTPPPDPTQVQGQAGEPSAPAGPGLGMLPAALSASQRMPAAPARPLPQPPDETSPNTDPSGLPQVRDPEDIRNVFERRGALLALAVEQQGQQLAQAMSQPPTNAVKLDNAQIADFWRFSPTASDEATANQNFWNVHDQVLQQTGDPVKAEQAAMQQVFPYRAALVGQGVASIDRQVETAQQIRKLVDGPTAPPDRQTALYLHAANNATNDEVNSLG